MKIRITGDFLQWSGLDEILCALEKNDYRSFFSKSRYGLPIYLGIVFRCVTPEIKLNSRSRFTKKDSFLAVDIVLPTEQFMALSTAGKREMVLSRLLSDLAKATSKHSPEFESERFINDLQHWINQINWGQANAAELTVVNP